MKKEKKIKLERITFSVGKNSEGFGTIIERYVDNVGIRRVTIRTEIPFKELKVINDFLGEYDLYVDIDNVLRKQKGLELKTY